MNEAMNERMIPGQGDMPLLDILRGIPSDVIVSSEVPLRSKRDAGVSDSEIVKQISEATRHILAQL